ncbi:mandelate racemase/muconate lactonizing enzyme family protein [Verminephrobacter eiseniae]|uniref:Putative mandelate racemase n=1 Tax=Verminephrobacter eiseniae (strain EF01-2) TaxID=391735 RepID=A1WRU4_VEREI|nr:mandelate racemase/muconate lactonizing enzyme family protein [Verminephrobacter eiseniae]ABM60351.1 putative mandelate racemase [Verminephrobacter eiseniae EF01-2]MCW5285836.1 mandelate racemase [Verminephrobacter eiseniae]MCW5304134.1 mandelate racemase [Verminephrobacter eiseniae]MCW8178592.1 mandelate racemase [Verminephrobacter eiseniae]MCW8189669.1 mandelate racemase [Verminephrobacter eiseniae]
MRIVDIREISVPLKGNVSNALVNFSEHTVSLVAVFSDVVRNGKPVVGVAFNSIGRFAQHGLLHERFIPRILKCTPESLLESDGRTFSAKAIFRAAMTNEKPGGHGDRATAVAALELAIWDLNAKLADEPAYVTIARAAGRPAQTRAKPVYAAGGYYYPEDSSNRLRSELQAYRDLGFVDFKIKIGGASLEEDLKRIHMALEISEGGEHLAVDANGRFDLQTALAYADAIAPLALRWYEEVGDPLDFRLNAEIASRYRGAIATGENLFSTIDTVNLMRFGGMRPGLDVFQMEAGLSYGLTEYMATLKELEAHGFSREQVQPHGGHLINLHIATGLGLGGCEVYPGVFQPFGGYSAACMVSEGYAMPTQAPGFGLEEKPGLSEAIAELIKR